MGVNIKEIPKLVKEHRIQAQQNMRILPTGGTRPAIQAPVGDWILVRKKENGIGYRRIEPGLIVPYVHGVRVTR